MAPCSLTDERFLSFSLHFFLYIVSFLFFGLCVYEHLDVFAMTMLCSSH